MAGGFFSVITKALLLLWVFSISLYCAHIHSAWLHNTEGLSHQSVAEAGGILSPPMGITEQISRVCIGTVLEDSPTFVAMNRLMVFFV